MYSVADFIILVKNAHSPEELKENPDNIKWIKKNKSDINLLEILDNLKFVFKQNKRLVKNPKFISQIEFYDSLDLIQLLNLWFDIACYHRKIITNLKYSGPNEGYRKVQDVPGFYIDNEEYMWSFQRTLRMCKDHINFLNYDGSPLSIRDMCVGSYNCKIGIHNENNVACIDDMINGSCDCIKKEEYDKQKTELEKLISNEKDSSKIREYKIKLSKLKRKVHYTEQNMIPLSKRILMKNQSEKAHFDETKIIKIKKIKKKAF